MKSVHESVYDQLSHLTCLLANFLIQLLTKKENSFYRTNTLCGENGTLRCAVPTDSTESSFAMRRLQLTEKMPLEVELEEYNDVQNVVVGVVPNITYTVPLGSLHIP